MIVDVTVSALDRRSVAVTLRQIADDMERESEAVTHWGGHLGVPGSYAVTITDPSAYIRNDL